MGRGHFGVSAPALEGATVTAFWQLGSRVVGSAGVPTCRSSLTSHRVLLIKAAQITLAALKTTPSTASIWRSLDVLVAPPSRRPLSRTVIAKSNLRSDKVESEQCIASVISLTLAGPRRHPPRKTECGMRSTAQRVIRLGRSVSETSVLNSLA